MNQLTICRVWEQPTGVAYRDNRAPIHYGVKGGADISGIVFDGRRLEIEVKTGKAVQQQNQVFFMEMIRKHNGIYVVARSVEGAIMAVKQEVNRCSN